MRPSQKTRFDISGQENQRCSTTMTTTRPAVGLTLDEQSQPTTIAAGYNTPTFRTFRRAADHGRPPLPPYSQRRQNPMHACIIACLTRDTKNKASVLSKYTESASSFGGGASSHRRSRGTMMGEASKNFKILEARREQWHGANGRLARIFRHALVFVRCSQIDSDQP
jgi:hypothetical protein